MWTSPLICTYFLTSYQILQIGPHPVAMAFLNVALSYFTFLSVGTLGVLLLCPAGFLCGFATTSAGIQVCSQPLPASVR